MGHRIGNVRKGIRGNSVSLLYKMMANHLLNTLVPTVPNQMDHMLCFQDLSICLLDRAQISTEHEVLFQVLEIQSVFPGRFLRDEGGK